VSACSRHDNDVEERSRADSSTMNAGGLRANSEFRRARSPFWSHGHRDGRSNRLVSATRPPWDTPRNVSDSAVGDTRAGKAAGSRALAHACAHANATHVSVRGFHYPWSLLKRVSPRCRRAGRERPSLERKFRISCDDEHVKISSNQSTTPKAALIALSNWSRGCQRSDNCAQPDLFSRQGPRAWNKL